MAIDKLAEEMAKLSCDITRACIRKEERFAAQYNLTPAEFRCLRLFTNSPALTIKSLTMELELTPGRITHILTSLEAKKYVTREFDPSDKRNVIVKLTKKSRPFLNKINLEHIKIHQQILDNVQGNNKTTVVEVMGNIATALHNFSNNKK